MRKQYTSTAKGYTDLPSRLVRVLFISRLIAFTFIFSLWILSVFAISFLNDFILQIAIYQ